MIKFEQDPVTEIKAWLKRENQPDEVIRIVLVDDNSFSGKAYLLYSAYDAVAAGFGRILFDRDCYWIYDGELLTITEQEQLARFIISAMLM